MAFRTRRRVVQPKEPVRFVSLDDPAVNTAPPEEGGSDTTTYKESSGRDRTGLEFTEDPTEYHCMPLTPAQHKDAQLEGMQYGAGTSTGLTAAFLRAFELGCKAIKPWVKEDGTSGPLPMREWPEQVPLKVQVEIGGYIMALSSMEETDPKS